MSVSASGAVAVKSDAFSGSVSASGAMSIASASGMAMAMSASGAVSMAMMTASGVNQYYIFTLYIILSSYSHHIILHSHHIILY